MEQNGDVISQNADVNRCKGFTYFNQCIFECYPMMFSHDDLMFVSKYNSQGVVRSFDDVIGQNTNFSR